MVLFIERIASSRPTVSVQSFLPKIEEQLEGRWNNHPVSLEYLARPDGSAALVHVVQIQNEEINSWYEAYVDAHSGELLSVTDFTAEAGVSAHGSSLSAPIGRYSDKYGGLTDGLIPLHAYSTACCLSRSKIFERALSCLSILRIPSLLPKDGTVLAQPSLRKCAFLVAIKMKFID